MVAALATMESMTSEQITNTGSVSGDCGSAQARARTHVQAYVQTQARQNGSAKDGSATNGPARNDSAKDGPSGRKHGLQRCHAMLRPASRHALLPWLTSIIGVASALCLVIAWFPSTVWNTPIVSSDAPAHYYFIHRLLDEGLGAALHLWPHDSFYPPLFHICAYLVIKIAALFGVQCSIYAAFNITWIIASGVIFPAGMLVLCRYFLRRWNRGNPISNPISRISQASSTPESSSVSESSNISNQQVPSAGNRQYDAASDATFVLQNLIGLFVPVLAVSSVCHPYGLLNAGPLIAFGFATSLLPFLIAATLRLFDAIAAREHIAKWLAIAAVAGVVCLVAHPRIAFTYALILVPFIVLRLPWKLILGAFIAMCVGAVAFVALMLTSFKSDRWANPDSWFHSHQPSKNLWESISFCLTDGLDGFPAILFALLLIAGTAAAFVCASRRAAARASDSFSSAASTVVPVASADVDVDASTSDIAVSAADSPVSVSCPPPASHSNATDAASASSESSRLRRNDRLRDVIALTAAFLLVALVYVCTVTLVGALPNIISAPWYRDENRIMTMLPLVALPLLVIGINALAECVSACAASASFAPSASSFSTKNSFFRSFPFFCVCCFFREERFFRFQLDRPNRRIPCDCDTCGFRADRMPIAFRGSRHDHRAFQSEPKRPQRAAHRAKDRCAAQGHETYGHPSHHHFRSVERFDVCGDAVQREHVVSDHQCAHRCAIRFVRQSGDRVCFRRCAAGARHGMSADRRSGILPYDGRPGAESAVIPVSRPVRFLPQ